VNIVQWLEKLKAAGVELSLHSNGQDLSFRATKAALTPEIRTEIVARKAELIEYFQLLPANEKISRSDKTEKFCLSAAQQRLWFQEQFNGAPNNLAGAVRLQGLLSVDALETSLQGIVSRHAVFRTRFGIDAEGQSHQDIVQCPPFVLQKEDLSKLPDVMTHVRQRIEKLSAEGFDLQKPVFLRASLFKLGTDDHILSSICRILWLMVSVCKYLIKSCLRVMQVKASRSRRSDM